jgi:multiple sugar transport system substrate-binding protein
MKTRFGLLITLTAVTAIVFAGCAPDAPATTPVVPPTGETPVPEPVDPTDEMPSFAGQTLSVASTTGGGGTGTQPAYDACAVELGINLDLVQLPYAELRERALLDFVSNTGTYDVVQVDGAIWAAEMAPYLVPLDDLLASDPLPEHDDFIPAVLNAMRVPYPSGTTYAIPIRYGTLIYHYRADLFREAGLTAPQNWDEYLDVAQKLTGDGVYGTLHAGQQGNFLVYNWFAFLYGFNSDFLNEDQTEVVMGDRAVEATQFWADLYLTHQVVPPGITSYEHGDVIVAMQQGVGASSITYSPYALNFIDPTDSRFPGVENWGWAAIPTRDPGQQSGGVGSGWGLGINRDARNQDLAWEFIKCATSPEMNLMVALEAANAPVRRSVFLNPEFQSLFPAADATLEALEGDRIRPGLTNWTAIEEVLASELSQALVGSKSARDSINDSIRQINELLQRQ